MIVGVCSVRDEVDVIAATVRHHLAECDAVIVEDHLSTDGTLEELLGLRVPCLTVLANDDPSFDQPAIMNRLAELAERMGATWVVPFDADEVWFSRAGRLRDVLPLVQADVCVATVYEHVPRPDDAGPDPLRRMVHRRILRWSWDKVAIRTGRGLKFSVGQHVAIGHSGEPDTTTLEMRHFPWRSREQTQARFTRNSVTAGAANHVAYHCSLLDLSPEDWESWWSGMTDAEGTVVDPAPVR